jgi:ubiquinone/menaquinone biosynthesis C-methylase UbiE
MTSKQETWAAGDFAMMGAGITLVGELLSEAVRLRAGERVLDVATGSGNTAIAAARRATDVVGVDFVPALLDRARERAHAERLKRVTFELGDAESLQFADSSFDVVLSTFGCMFAPDPVAAAREMARVCRPGGRLGITAWTPAGLWGRVFAIHARYLPDAPGVAAPVLWGEENIVRERLGEYAAQFSFTRRAQIFRARTADQWLAFLREFFGPTVVLWAKLDEAGRETFSREVLDTVAEFNQSGDQTLFVPAEYLESVITLK